MIRAAWEGGTTDIVATPHANAEYAFDRARAGALRQRLEEAAENQLRIHLGCDLHLGYEWVERALANPAEFSIDGNGYMLVEPPESLPAKTVTLVCARLRAAGLRPILTHPERYAFLQGRERHIEAWVEDGILMQITGGSLLGHFGSAARKTAERLIARGHVHFLASDAHDPIRRSPDLSEVYRLVEDRWGSAAAIQLLDRNPRAALAGEPVEKVAVPSRVPWLSFVR
jgi:protein-tyrosine phosphatase